MRDIKFRAWTPNYGGQMRTPNEFIVADGRVIGVNGGLNNAQWILMQFTGLLDKHGKEIYEGDILQGGGHWSGSWDNEKFEVKYEDGKFYPWGTGDWEKDSYTYEIIGNIYENPELLTVK